MTSALRRARSATLSVSLCIMSLKCTQEYQKNCLDCDKAIVYFFHPVLKFPSSRRFHYFGLVNEEELCGSAKYEMNEVCLINFLHVFEIIDSTESMILLVTPA